MSNPLFQTMNQGGPMNGLLQRFQQFQQMFKGDPQKQVQQLLNSGKVSQSQYNQAVQMAQQFQRMLGK
jgi:vancomycin permeability regulator SanA